MKGIAIIGLSRSGKSSFGHELAEALDTACTDTGDLIRQAMHDVTGAPLSKLESRDEETRKALYAWARNQCDGDEAYWFREALKLGLIVAGIRAREELEAARPLLMLTIWIERPQAARSSTDRLYSSDADIVVNNNGHILKLGAMARLLAGGIRSWI